MSTRHTGFDSINGSKKRKKDCIKRRPLQAPVANKKLKTDESKNFKPRKRSQSSVGGKTFLPYKKKKNNYRSFFLLGGNISDPLNLKSLADGENRMSSEEENKGIFEVIGDPSDTDPLSLKVVNDNIDESYFASIQKTKLGNKPKKKKKKIPKGSCKDESDTKSDVKINEVTTHGESSSAINKLEIHDKSKDSNKEFKKPKINEKRSSTDKIVSPVVPVLPGSWFRKPGHRKANLTTPKFSEKKCKTQYGNYNRLDENNAVEATQSKSSENNPPEIQDKCKEIKEENELRREKKSNADMVIDEIVSPVIPAPNVLFRKSRRSKIMTPKFNNGKVKKISNLRYGNYFRYYGYRNLGLKCDPRLSAFSQLKHLFLSSDVLDIGCNTGVISISVAQEFSAKSVVGIDIDKNLIEIAKQNLRSSVKVLRTLGQSSRLPVLEDNSTFPSNITFVRGNYVPENDALLEVQEQHLFDTILCLSVTKWIHLNHGDVGLKRAFKRMFSQLRPGGVLILEAQEWSSYSRKKSLCETIWKNYKEIKFRPEKFKEYLLSEVGFSKCEILSTPEHPQKGFQRPIKLFTKGKIRNSCTQTPCEEDSELKSCDETQMEVEMLPNT